MNTADFRHLSSDRKIELVFELWDEIADSSAPVELSESVKMEIDQRCAELDADPSIAIDQRELWRRVNER
ncbi:MAG: addiction module protein [Pirellula sp.]|jgi:putative addiction module component (TIGR02574 family)|nr:addiction module protein [Pirellula sp.]